MVAKAIPESVKSLELRACFDSIPALAEQNVSVATETKTDLMYCTLPVKSEWLADVSRQFDKVQFAIDATGRLLLLGWHAESIDCAVIPVSFAPRL